MQATLTKIDSCFEEQVLLKHLSNGDRTAFWQLWERYRDYLARRCQTWMGGNLIDAEEALSQAMLTRDRLRKSLFCQSAKILKKLLIKMIIIAEGEGRRRATLASFPCV